MSLKRDFGCFASEPVVQKGRSGLSVACQDGNLEIAQWLIARGASVYDMDTVRTFRVDPTPLFSLSMSNIVQFVHELFHG